MCVSVQAECRLRIHGDIVCGTNLQYSGSRACRFKDLLHDLPKEPWQTFGFRKTWGIVLRIDLVQIEVWVLGYYTVHITRQNFSVQNATSFSPKQKRQLTALSFYMALPSDSHAIMRMTYWDGFNKQPGCGVPPRANLCRASQVGRGSRKVSDRMDSKRQGPSLNWLVGLRNCRDERVTDWQAQRYFRKLIDWILSGKVLAASLSHSDQIEIRDLSMTLLLCSRFVARRPCPRG